MVSAAITSLSRLVFEFHKDLDPAMASNMTGTMHLFDSPNCEIGKSVLGFIKVTAISLDVVSSVGRTSARVKLRHFPERLVLRNDARLTNRLSKPTVVDRMISTPTTSLLQSPSLRRHRYRQGAWQLQEHYLYRAWYTTVFEKLTIGTCSRSPCP